MTKSSTKDEIGGFVELLQRSGLLLDAQDQALFFDDEDVADMLWLAQHIQVKNSPADPSEEQSPKANLVSDKKSTISETRTEIQTEEENKKKGEETADITTTTEAEKLGESASQFDQLPINVPKARSFLNPLKIRKAFRPLRRRVPSRRQSVLDVDETVDLITEQLILGREVWIPVMKPERERWLDLEIVIEQSESSMIWQELMHEFQLILSTHGDFRRIRVWYLSVQGEKFALELERRGKRKKPQHHPKELCHPEQRGMILLVSDCTSDIWEKGTIYPQLHQWSKTTLLGVVQLFPEHLWRSTWLNQGRKFFAKSGGFGELNAKLRLMGLPRRLRATLRSEPHLLLPILTMSPEMIDQWSRLRTGSAEARLPVYVFLEPQNYQPEKRVKTFDIEQMSAEMRVEAFMATASEEAVQLAGMMSAVPVDMRVVNLIRTELLPEVAPHHVAEVFMSGLMVANQQQPGQYDFTKEVRKIIIGKKRRDELVEVLNIISRAIAEELNRPIRTFRALLTLLPYYDEAEKDKVLPFARVTIEVLENLGGEYASFAEKVKQNIPQKPPTEEELESYRFEVVEFVEGIDWQELEFETVELSIEDWVTFEFQVGSLERGQVQLRPGEAEGFIEVLSEGDSPGQTQSYQDEEALLADVTLEMVRIPAGEYVMGAPEQEEESGDSERPQHVVKIAEFGLGRYPITQEQWAVVAGWESVDKELEPYPSTFNGYTHPVENVSWEDTKEFCGRLSKKTGKKYRLPTEAEWEYACRAINLEELSGGDESEKIQAWNKKYSQPFSFGETISADLSNYSGDYVYGTGRKGEYQGKTTTVGNFPANNFGLHDMHGNVWEWCEDDYHDNYQDAPKDGRAWIDKDDSQTLKITRGGSWYVIPWYCRSAVRGWFSRADRRSSIGFRVAVSLP